MIRGTSLLVVLVAAVTLDADLLCFQASWCTPCQQMRPTLQRLQQEGYRLHMIDIDARPQLAAKYGVTTIPCFIEVDAQGQPRARVNRAADYGTLARMAGTRQAPQGPQPSHVAKGAASPRRGIRPLVQTTASLAEAPAQGHRPPRRRT